MHSLQKGSKVCTTPDISNSSASAETAAQGRSPGEEDWLCSVSCGSPWDQRWSTDSSNHLSSALRDWTTNCNFYKSPGRLGQLDEKKPILTHSALFLGEKKPKNPKHTTKTQTKPNQTQRAPQSTGKFANLWPPNLWALAKQLHSTDVLSLDSPGRHN